MPVTGSEADRPRRRRHPAGGRWAAALAASATIALIAGTAIATPALGAGPTASPAARAWHLVKHTHRAGNPIFTAITASSRTHGWAFLGQQTGRSRPLAYRLTGSGWHKAAFPRMTGEYVTSAAATSASDAFALTGGGKNQALRWNGTAWKIIGTFAAPVYSVTATDRKNAWAFGKDAWHWNGHKWAKASSGHGLSAGYALSSTSAWAVGGRSVARWNGRTWKKTSVARLLPPDNILSHSRLEAIWAYSRRSVWAVGTGGREDEGGPAVVLHYNGHHWSQEALDNNTGSPEAVVPDPAGGLWIPALTRSGTVFQMLHYDNGTLKTVTVPYGGAGLTVYAMSAVPGSDGSLAAGFTHKAHNLGARSRGAIIKYRP
jgi:hypothetical protein